MQKQRVRKAKSTFAVYESNVFGRQDARFRHAKATFPEYKTNVVGMQKQRFRNTKPTFLQKITFSGRQINVFGTHNKRFRYIQATVFRVLRFHPLCSIIAGLAGLCGFGANPAASCGLLRTLRFLQPFYFGRTVRCGHFGSFCSTSAPPKS